MIQPESKIEPNKKIKKDSHKSDKIVKPTNGKTIINYFKP